VLAVANTVILRITIRLLAGNAPLRPPDRCKIDLNA
jgi:hypothetical protein